MNQKLTVVGCLLSAFLVTSCLTDHQTPAPPIPTLRSDTLTRGLRGLISVDTDSQGRIWVTQAGSGKNDANVSMVDPNGNVYPAITGFDSEMIQGGEINGLNHLLFVDGWLYILGSHSRLYKVNVASFKPGDAPIAASSLVPEDLKQVILDHKFTTDFSKFISDTEDTHFYNMVVGPDGALYVTDAGANAIIRRSKTGEWSILNQVPGIANPTPPIPPFVESVPTGITFNGKEFIIGTLLGYPFPAGHALIYKMDLSGNLTAYPQLFTSLVDIENDGNGGILALEHGSFGGMGFTPGTGRLVRSNGTNLEVVLDHLVLPTDLKVVDNHTAYMTSLTGTLTKITF